MVESGVFIFLGGDELAKQKKIEDLQKKLFPANLKDLNYDLLYADEKQLKVSAFKEILSCLPTEGARKRLVVIKNAHRLTSVLADCLGQELPKIQNKMIVVLDVPDVKAGEGFVKEFVKKGASVLRFKSEIPTNVFDLGRAMISRQPEACLKILSNLKLERQRAEKILGVIFWQWEHAYSQKALGDDAYKRGLKLILDADRRLKNSSSGVAREVLILEALVVKLSYLPR